MVVRGNSGPYLSFLGSPSLLVTGLALPYGLPRLFMQITKNLEISKALPGPPSSGPHQSLTSALPVNAWQMTITLSRFGDNVPLVLYANGALYNVSPDSRVKDGTMAICWSGIRAAKGFSGCCCVLSWTYSAAVLVLGVLYAQNYFVFGGVTRRAWGELTKDWHAGEDCCWAIGLCRSSHFVGGYKMKVLKEL